MKSRGSTSFDVVRLILKLVVVDTLNWSTVWWATYWPNCDTEYWIICIRDNHGSFRCISCCSSAMEIRMFVLRILLHDATTEWYRGSCFMSDKSQLVLYHLGIIAVRLPWCRNQFKRVLLLIAIRWTLLHFTPYPLVLVTEHNTPEHPVRYCTD